jgi:phosphoribosylanthranilate isomerase
VTGWVKICGITSIDDAEGAARAGADAIGLNFVASSPRVVGPEVAREIAEAIRGRVQIVAVVVPDPHLDAAELGRLIEELGLDFVQLHGPDTGGLARTLSPKAFEAHAIGDAGDVNRARTAPGSLVLLDARVGTALGGTGKVFDWSLVVELARERDVVLAGGLTPDNVGAAIHAVRPWGVDVASGVERAGDRRAKDPAKVARFVEAARAAWRGAP